MLYLFVTFAVLLHNLSAAAFGQQEGNVNMLLDNTAGKIGCQLPHINHGHKKGLKLSIVIPCYNAQHNVLVILDRLYSGHLRSHKSEFEVFLVDDLSTDSITEELPKHAFAQEPHFHFLQQCEQSGAGQARNRVIPLLSGEYTYFLDADDDANFERLWEAMTLSRSRKTDLMFLPYQISMPAPGTLQMKTRDMWPPDQKYWAQGEANRAAEPKLKLYRNKKAALMLTNYPWIRIIRTDILQAGQIFFGPTPVHNDVQFHWLSIARARSIEFFHKPVCLHRKNPTMHQITNIASKDRLAVVDALRLTDLMLQRCKCFFSHEELRPLWSAFAKKLLQWAKNLVPKECKALYRLRSTALLDQLQAVEGTGGMDAEEAHPDYESAERIDAEAKCNIRTYSEHDLPDMKP
jgi:hypothetical protein